MSETYLERVHRGDYDDRLIDVYKEPPDFLEGEIGDMKAAELQEIASPDMTRLARKAYNDRNWREVTGGSSGYTNFNLERLQKLCFFLYRNNWLASNVIDNFTYLTAGGGFRVEWSGDTDGNKWKEIEEETRWPFRQMEIIQATYCFGQYFSLRWPLSPFGEVQPPKQKPSVRGIDPWHIKPIPEPDDPEKFNHFFLNNAKKLHPEDVIYHRIRYVGNYGEGLPVMISVLDPLYYAEKFLSNQHWLHHIRCRIPLIYKVHGASTDVNAAKSRFGTTLPRPGVIRFANPGEDVIFPHLNLGATDSFKLYRTIILAVSEGVGLPEFLVGGSAENSAYASLLAQESPTVRKIQHAQNLFASDFRRIIIGLTGKKNFQLVIPPVVERDFGELAKAWVMLYQANLVSRQTANEKIGNQWEGEDGEKARLAAEMFDVGEFPVPEGYIDPELEEAVNDVFRKKPSWRRNMVEEIKKLTKGNGEVIEAFLERTA